MFEEFGRKRCARLEGVLLEDALAEAVDGADGGLVHLRERIGEQLPGPGRFDPGEQGGEQRVNGGAVQGVEGLAHPGADAVAQLTGGRTGEGHHQDPVHAQLPLEYQPEEEQGQGVGFAGAGAGLEQAAAGEGDGERIEGLHVSSPGGRGWSGRARPVQ